MTCDELLRTAGVSRCYLGFSYFVTAVEMVAEDTTRLRNMRRLVYRPLASEHGVEIKNIERNIRTVRDVVLRNGGPEFMALLMEGRYSEDLKMYPREIIEAFADFVKSGKMIPPDFVPVNFERREEFILPC